MFSTRLERLRQFNRLAVLVAATLLAVGILLIAVWAVRAFNMLGVAEADRAPIIIGVLIALAVLVACEPLLTPSNDSLLRKSVRQARGRYDNEQGKRA